MLGCSMMLGRMGRCQPGRRMYVGCTLLVMEMLGSLLDLLPLLFLQMRMLFQVRGEVPELSGVLFGSS